MILNGGILVVIINNKSPDIKTIEVLVDNDTGNVLAVWHDK